MHHDTRLAYSEQEQKFIRLMLDAAAQGNEVYTSCERLIKSLRKRQVTPDAFLRHNDDSRLKQELLAQTMRANKLEAELHELHTQHSRQLEYLENLKPPVVTGRMHWTK